MARRGSVAPWTDRTLALLYTQLDKRNKRYILCSFVDASTVRRAHNMYRAIIFGVVEGYALS